MDTRDEERTFPLFQHAITSARPCPVNQSPLDVGTWREKGTGDDIDSPSNNLGLRISKPGLTSEHPLVCHRVRVRFSGAGLRHCCNTTQAEAQEVLQATACLSAATAAVGA